MGFALGLAGAIVAGIILMVIRRYYDRHPDRMEAIFLLVGGGIIGIVVGSWLIVIAFTHFDYGANDFGEVSNVGGQGALLLGGGLLVATVAMLGSTVAYLLKPSSEPRKRRPDRGTPLQYLVLTPQQQTAHRKILAIDSRAKIISTTPFIVRWTPKHADKPLQLSFDEQGKAVPVFHDPRQADLR
jgi:MFS family permease